MKGDSIRLFKVFEGPRLIIQLMNASVHHVFFQRPHRVKMV